MRFAYADPPYPGQAQKHYGDHSDFAGEVDHVELIERLERDFDGWALSTNAKSLQMVLGLCPRGEPKADNPLVEREGSGIRVLIWHKPQSPHFPSVISYMWEPVILRGWRPPQAGDPQPHDHISVSPEGWTFGGRITPDDHVIGQKPPAFCRWLFECAGLDPEDEFVDLFPGSGAVAKEWERWISEPRLRTSHPLDIPRNARRERERTHPQLDTGSPADG